MAEKRKRKPPSDEGFTGVAKESKRKPPSDEGGGPKGRRERKCFDISVCFRKIRDILSPSQLR